MCGGGGQADLGTMAASRVSQEEEHTIGKAKDASDVSALRNQLEKKMDAFLWLAGRVSFKPPPSGLEN